MGGMGAINFFICVASSPRFAQSMLSFDMRLPEGGKRQIFIAILRE